MGKQPQLTTKKSVVCWVTKKGVVGGCPRDHPSCVLLFQIIHLIPGSYMRRNDNDAYTRDEL